MLIHRPHNHHAGHREYETPGKAFPESRVAELFEATA